jgi:predicted Zn-dependent peptidase
VKDVKALSTKNTNMQRVGLRRKGGPGIALALSFLVLTLLPVGAGAQQSTATRQAPSAKSAAEAVRLVTEFEVNGLKVLVKRREGSQTVVAGLFMRYGINFDYSALTLASTRRHFDRSWEIFTDAALHPSFAPEDFARVKNRIVIGLSDDQDVPDSYLQILQSRIAYKGHPYLNDPHGTADSVSRLTIDDVKKFHQNLLQTSRLLLVIVGDIDPQEVRRKVEATLGQLPRGNYRPSPLPPLVFNAQTVEVTSRSLPTNYVSGVFAAPPLSMPDIYPMRIAASILQGRVFNEVRVRRNLSYAPDAFLGSQAANLGGIYVTAVDANQAVRVMLEEVARLQNEQVSTEELQATAQLFLTKHYLGQETNAAQAGDLAQNELLGGGWRNSAVFLERLGAVTPEEIKRVANKYMRNIRFVVLGNPQSVDVRIFTGQAGG